MSARPDRLQFYKADGGWRWRYRSNGRTLADGGQGYSRRRDAAKGAARTLGTDHRLLVDGMKVTRAMGPMLVEVRA